MQFSWMKIKVWVLCLTLAALLSQPINGLAQIQSSQPLNLGNIQQVKDWTFTVIARDTNGSLGVASISDSGELLLTQNDGTKYNLLL